MNLLGPQVSAGLFTDRDMADKAWGALSEAGIPSAVIVDPGLLGKYEVCLMVERDDLDKAQAVLAEFFND
jgi:hypothetical protein